MKHIASIIATMLAVISMQNTEAQTFASKKSLTQFNNVKFSATADFNDDTLLDLATIEIDQSQNAKLKFYSNTGSLDFKAEPTVLQIPDHESFIIQAADINHDGKIDLLLAGLNINTRLVTMKTYINKGNFIFEQFNTLTPLGQIYQFEFSDLDNDGKKDLIVSGHTPLFKDTMLIYAQNQNQFVLSPCDLQNAVGAFCVVDINGDARADLLASKLENGKRYNKMFLNKGNLNFKADTVLIDSLTLSTAKQIRLGLNDATDVVLVGKDATGLEQIKIYEQYTGLTFKLYEKLNVSNAAHLTIADCNHDGLSDLLCLQKTATSKLHLFAGSQKGFVPIQVIDTLADYVISDFYIEGNPDLIVFTNTNARLLTNSSSQNLPPMAPEKPKVASYNGKIVVGWNTPSDDATPSNLLSFDMYINDNEGAMIYSPESFVPQGYRKVYSLGSIGFGSTYKLHTFPLGRYKVAVQAIDNTHISNYIETYSPGGDCVAGSLGGSGGRRGFSPEATILACDQIAIKHIDACKGSKIVLEAHGQETPDWYSVNQGFLSTHNILNYKTGSTLDTVISSSMETCSNSIMYVIHVKPEPVALQIIDTTVCPHSKITLKAKEKGLGAQWYTALDSIVYKTETLDYVSGTKRDTIYLSYRSNLCAQVPTYVVHIVDTVQVPQSVEVCLGGSLALENGASWTAVEWKDAQGHVLRPTNAQAPITYSPQNNADTFLLKKGLYKNCAVIDTLKLKLLAKPSVQVSADAPAGFGPTQLHASGGMAYLWTPATGLSAVEVPNPLAAPIVSTEYNVKVTNALGCVDSSKIKVNIKYDLFVPNLFSPNGDGSNDLFQIYGHGISNLLFKIYDRSGSVLFETTDLSKTWDGKHNGSSVSSGTYAWTISGQFANGDPVQYQGESAGYISLIY